MNAVDTMTTTSRVRWDGSMVLFDLAMDDETVACGISREALEQIGPSRCFRKEDALACFAKARPLIERLALEKLLARPAGLCGRLTLWADDVELPPSDDAGVGLQQRSA